MADQVSVKLTSNQYPMSRSARFGGRSGGRNVWRTPGKRAARSLSELLTAVGLLSHEAGRSADTSRDVGLLNPALADAA